MTLKDRLGLLQRSLFAGVGLLLIVATVATTYRDWPLVQAHKASPFGFFLTCGIALPVALLIVIWSVIGQLKEWRIEGDHLSIRLMSLTSWMSVLRVKPAQIRAVAVESYAYEDDHNRTAHWIVLQHANGRRYRSPTSYDGAEIEAARTALETLRAGSRLIGEEE